MIDVPKEIREQIELGAAIAISISGGKDSQALLKAVPPVVRKYGCMNQMFAIHAHLGRMEWPQTLDHCRKICEKVDIPLVVVEREKGDLIDRWKDRMEKLEGTGKPFWSSSSARYCTSDLKRAPINKYLRKFDRVISVEGIRSEESRSRRKKPAFKIRKKIQTQTRTAYTWNAIKDWTEEQVWESWGHNSNHLHYVRHVYEGTGVVLPWWKFHPVYAMGNDRVSCCICILQNKNDRINGIKHNPKVAKTLISMERESGFSFWMDTSIKELKEEMDNNA